MSKENDKKAKLLEAIKLVNKNYGAGTVKLGSDEPPKTSFDWPVPELNAFCKSLVRGNFSVLWGGNSVGKSTLAYQTIAHLQKQDHVCCLIDTEHNFSVDRATSFGINLSELLLVTSTETAEEGMDVVIRLCKEKVVDFFVVDSVQAMSPEGEQVTKNDKEKSIADDEMALLARKLSKFFRVCATPLYKANAHLLLIGQVRKGLGSFIVQDSLSGGEAQMHWATAILNMRKGQKADFPQVKEKIETEDGKTETITRYLGHSVVFKIGKTKVTGSKPEMSTLEIPFYYDTGFLPQKTEVVTTDSVTAVVAEQETTKSSKKSKKNLTKD